MNYIVLDLEWNQCPDGKEKENKELPFEIIEIGAIKLDENRRYIDTFHRLIAPQVYQVLHHVTRELIQTTMDDLKKGEDYVTAVESFLNWCEEDYIFCTWGSMDLTELQRNNRFFGVRDNFPQPFIYYDLQKSYSLCYDDGKSRVSLETAIEEMQIEKDNSFHSALFDAQYTAKIMQKMDFDKVKTYSSVDTYVIPKNRKDEFTINYGTYSKFVSKGYNDKDDVLKDGYILSSECYLCKKNAKKKIKWFSGNQKTYYCVAKCDTHGYLKGRIKIKKTDDDKYYAVKIMKITDSDGAAAVRERQAAAREKRRERRHKVKLRS